jgi:protein-disulfide isomerase
MPPLHVLVLVLAAITVAGCTTTPATPSSAPETRIAAGSPPGDFNVLGRADAPVTLIEFTDQQCPHCARHALETFPLIRRNYVDTGKLRYTSRDLPLPFHPFALPAAVAARCAGEQGRFWEYRARLFEEQSRLGTAPYQELALDLGLDVARFDACRSDGRQEANVRADIELAHAQGIGSTPSFVIGRLADGVFTGETFSGAQSYARFAARIDALLAAGP